ncbi:MAG TPA: hypothetical protein VF770_03765, partial [Solirubrobacterales bacterium]
EADGEWWRRFEAELEADLGAWPPAELAARGEGERQLVRAAGSAAAVVAELASSGESVLALVAAAPRRATLARPGLEAVEYTALDGEPELVTGFEHVVLVDPPAFAHLERLAARPTAGGGYLHPAWGEGEWRFALATLARRLARRAVLIAAFRDLREAGEASGERLLEALRGGGSRPRGPEAAARCFRVLEELGLVRGRPRGGDGAVGVVSSEGTDLERSAAFRAYGARYEEGRRYLERRRHP